MKKIVTVLSIITFSLISCKNEAETTENTIPKVVVPFYQVTSQQQNQVATTPQPNQNQNVLYSGASAQNTTAPVAVAKGMNPAHGQPGHRCDIPVGAPLNTSTVTTNTANNSVISNSKITVPSASATTTKTPKGMNPPHGQPGHRCDIPVGSPLNSPIATNKPATSEVTSNYNVTVPAATATTQTPVNPAATPEGMNPPHGQDKHRCDIAVGAPLPKE